MLLAIESPLQMKILLSILTAFFVTSHLHAEVANLDEARKLSDQIMRSIGTGDYKTAFDAASPHWPIAKEEIDAMRSKTDEQLGMASRRFGALVGTEFVKTQAAGESLIRYVYIQKFRNHATRWMIVFYRPEKAWRINVIVWDDQLQNLFEPLTRASP
jgi:hypothetical protein